MTRRRFTHSMMVGLLAVASATSADPAPNNDPPDTRHQMAAVLPASAPHASLGDQARLFDRFVGTWDCDYTVHSEDGTIRRSPGELLFGWVLDGRAMQDIWIGYPTPGSGGERSIGTSLRIFDKNAGTWRVVWVAASFGFVINLQGGAEGNRIVLRGKDTDGSDLRWSFNDIKADSFVWRGENSKDGGKTWQLEEEHFMHRRTSAASR